MKYGTGSNIFSSWVSVLLAATLSACGSQFSNPSPNPTVTPQAVVFEVDSMVPEDNDSGVREDAKIEVTFSVAVNPKTLTAKSFSITGYDSSMNMIMAITGRISYDEKTFTATLTPTNNLENGQSYTVLLTRGVTDAKGAKLARTEWEFTVRPPPLTKVIHKSPADKAIGIALNTGIRVDFPTRLKPSTVPGALVLKDSNGTIIPGTLKYTQMPLEGYGESIYFQPNAALSAKTTYTATLSKSIITLTGDPHNPEKALDQDEVWSYTTATARTSTLKVGDVFGDRIVAADVDTANNVFSLANIETIDQDGNSLPTMTVIKSDNQGNILWQKPVASYNFGGSVGIAVGTDNNPIVTGSKVEAIGTDPALGSLDIIVAKLDGASGNLLWTRQIGTDNQDEATDVSVDAANNIYVSGSTFGTFAGKTAGGGLDGVVVSLRPDGTDRWLTQFGSDIDDTPKIIGVNSTSNFVFVVGETFSAPVPVPGGPPNIDGSDIFVTRLASTDGVVAVTTLFGGAGAQFPKDAVVSTNGVYISAIDVMKQGGLVLALDAMGTTVTWQKIIKLGEYTELRAIDVDAAGNPYIAGWFHEPKSMGDFITGVFVQKLDSATLGTMVWENKNIPVTSDNDMNHEYPAYADASALVLDSNGNIFIAGTVHNGGLIDGHVNYGWEDGYVLKMNSAGEVQ